MCKIDFAVTLILKNASVVYFYQYKPEEFKEWYVYFEIDDFAFCFNKIHILNINKIIKFK